MRSVYQRQWPDNHRIVLAEMLWFEVLCKLIFHTGHVMLNSDKYLASSVTVTANERREYTTTVTRLKHSKHYLDSIKILAELCSLLLVLHFQLAQFFIDVRIFLLIEPQDTLKSLTELFALIFQHFFIKLWLLYWIKFWSKKAKKKKTKKILQITLLHNYDELKHFKADSNPCFQEVFSLVTISTLNSTLAAHKHSTHHSYQSSSGKKILFDGTTTPQITTNPQIFTEFHLVTGKEKRLLYFSLPSWLLKLHCAST